MGEHSEPIRRNEFKKFEGLIEEVAADTKRLPPYEHVEPVTAEELQAASAESKARLNYLYGKYMGQADVVEEVKKTLYADSLVYRKWVYSVVMAVMLIATTWQGWQAITMLQWTNLLEALLALGGAGVANMARKNVK